MAERSVWVHLRAKVSDYNRSLGEAAVATRAFVRELESSDSHMTNLIQTSLALGPALVPLGAALVPTISGLTAALGFAAVGAGVTALAFGGIGDSLKALNDYQMDPTAANFEKLNEEMAKLGPAGREFVHTLQDLRPQLQGLQDVAQAEMFPGVTEGIEQMMERMPEVEAIVATVADSVGNIIADAGTNLNDPRWKGFFTYLEKEAGPGLEKFAQATGLLFEGIANMVMAFDPLNDMFFDGFVDWMDSFRDWSAGLDTSEGFAKFVDYIQRIGPEAADALGSIIMALVELTKATAPVGEQVLRVLTFIADGLSAIAGSPAGPVLIGAAAGISALSRAVALYNIVGGAAITAFLRGSKKDGPGAALAMGKVAGAAGLMAASLTDLDDKAGLANTTMGTFLGVMVKGAKGGGIGAALGFVKDMIDADDAMQALNKSAEDALRSGDIDQMRERLASLREGTVDLLTPAAWSDNPLAAFKDNSALIVSALTGQVDTAEQHIEDLNRRLRDSENAAGGLPHLFGSALGPAIDETGDSFEAAALSADAFVASLENVNAFLEKRASFRAYRQAIDDFKESIKEFGAVRDPRKEGGRENQAAFDQIASSGLQFAGSLKGLDRINFLDNLRSQLRDAAEAMNIPKERLREILNNLDLLDKNKAKPKVEVEGTEESKDKVNGVDRLLDQFDGTKAAAWVDVDVSPAAAALSYIDQRLDWVSRPRESRIYVTTVYSQQGHQTPGLQEYAGGVISAYAHGDVRNAHQPLIAPGKKQVRVWAEEETRGESYIPHANDWRRPRAIAVWEETGRILGLQFQRFAEGGIRPGSYSPAPATVSLSGMGVSGVIEIPGLGVGYLRGVASDTYSAEARHDRITGRR